MFLLAHRIVEGECSSIGIIVLHTTPVVNSSVEMTVARQSPCQSCFEYGTLPVTTRMVVIAGVAMLFEFSSNDSI